MSAPSVPSTPGTPVGESLLKTVALEEAALAHLVNAEAEKVERLAETLPAPSTFEDVLQLQKTLLAVLNVLVLKEMLLLDKVKSVKHLPVPCRCPKPPSFWRTRPEDWPVTSLELGCEEYRCDELSELLETSPAGNPSVVLARQLIAAKLNMAGGSDGGPATATVCAADDLLCEIRGRLPCCFVSPEHRRPMVTLARQLEAYNQGHMTHGCIPWG